MAHKQIPGLKDQLGLVSYQLDQVTNLEKEAPQSSPGAPFPVVMSATVVGLSLQKARHLLEEAAGLLQAEIDYFSETDQRKDDIQAGEGDEASKTEAVDAINKEAGAREARTAGTAAYCMQSVSAATIFMLKGLEKSRTYRS